MTTTKATKPLNHRHSLHLKANEHNAPEATTAIVESIDGQVLKTVAVELGRVTDGDGDVGGGVAVPCEAAIIDNLPPQSDEKCPTTEVDNNPSDLLVDAKRIAPDDVVDDVITAAKGATSECASDATVADQEVDSTGSDQAHASSGVVTDSAQDLIQEHDDTTTISSITDDDKLHAQLNDVDNLQAPVTHPNTDPHRPLDEVEAKSDAGVDAISSTADSRPDGSSIKCSLQITGLEDNQPISTAPNDTLEVKSSEQRTGQLSEASSVQGDDMTTVNSVLSNDDNNIALTSPPPLQSEIVEDSSPSDILPHCSDSPLSATVHPAGNLRSTITGISIAYTRLKLKLLKMQLKSTKNRSYRDDLSTGESLAHLSLVPGTTTDINSGEDNDGNTTPSEDNNGNTAPSEDNDGHTAPSEDNDSNTAPSEDNNGNAAPSEDNDGNTAPSEDNDGNTTPSEDNNGNTAPSEDNDGHTAPSESEGFGENGAAQPPSSATTDVDVTRRTLPESYQKYSIDYEEGNV